MAFGFPAYHSDRYKIKAAHSHDGVAAVKVALKILSWSIKEETEHRILASSLINMLSWGEKIEIEFLPDNAISITSKCVLPLQCVDWGKNKANVDKFLAEIRKRA